MGISHQSPRVMSAQTGMIFLIHTQLPAKTQNFTDASAWLYKGRENKDC
jgi:hypothetical protein